MISKTNVLIIQQDLNTIAKITEKCIEAGVCENNIFSVTEIDSAQRYLEIAGISYVIINADMYNFVIATVIEQFCEFYPIQVIITGSGHEQRTLRMMNDKFITFADSEEDIVEFLQKKTSGSDSYTNTGVN